MRIKIPHKDSLISIIIPLYNEAANIEWHHGKIINFLSKHNINYEIIYVNDGSSDNSIDIVKDLAKSQQNVGFISFSRNFGKEAATTAGLRKASGDAAIIIDADGQHPIYLINTFIKEWYKGYQIVIGIRKSNKGEGLVKSFGSKLFYFVLRLVGTNNSAVAGLTDFRLIDRQVIDEYNKLTERNRVTRNLIDWLGFKRKLVHFDANERHAGKASYSIRKLTKLAIDGVVKQSTRPLKYIGLLGLGTSLLSVLAALFVIIEKYFMHDPLNLAISGTALLALFLSFLVGIVLLCQGLLALYLENVYHETQNRPLYIIDEEK